MNKWLVHLKAYHAKHPKLTYKEAMIAAKTSYAGKQKGTGVYGQEAEAAASIVKTAGDVSNNAISAVQVNKASNGAYSDKILKRKAAEFRKLKHRMGKQTFPQMSDDKLWAYIDSHIA